MQAEQLPDPDKIAARGCGLCGEIAARELYNAADRLRNSPHLFVIAQCESCGVLRTLPEMSDEQLARFYPNDYWGEEPTHQWIVRSQTEKTSFASRCGLAEGRILDVGCGSGFFLRALDPARWERFGVETGGPAARAANKALGEGSVFQGALQDGSFENATFDVITMWSALEHMNAPRAALIGARRLIKPKGSLIIQLPNADSYQLRWFKGDWFALDAPRHRYHFTPEHLNTLLAEAGFEIYKTSFASKAHNAHALRQSLKLQLKRRGYPSFALFYAAVPFIKPFDWFMSRVAGGATITLAARAV